MGPRALLAPSLLLVVLNTATALAVELPPSATRIAVAGKSQIYRSFGVAREGELYAPVGPALEALGLRVSVEGRHATARSEAREARWRVVEIPAAQGAGDRPIALPDADEPRVLRIGEALFLPVKAAARIARHGTAWDEETRLLSLVPQVTGVEVTEGTEGPDGKDPLRLRIEASGPVRATSMLLSAPWRLVIDLSPAVLEPEGGMPAARGAIQTIRVGQFGPTTVRVVIEAGQRITQQGLPATPTRELSAALTLGGEEQRPSIRTARRPAPKPQASGRPRQLASRGSLLRRDPRLLEELRAAAQGVLAGRVICVDAGHGGHDPGAKGLEGLWEKDMTLAMAHEVARALREAGAVVLMTREDDRYVSLDERIEFANAQGCDLFISIHCNAMPRPNMASGTETYYYTEQSFRLAQSLHAALVGHVGGRDGGVRQRRFAVVRRTTMPSVLLEVAYINHSGDAAKLADPEFRRGVGDAVRDGVLAYYGG